MPRIFKYVYRIPPIDFFRNLIVEGGLSDAFPYCEAPSVFHDMPDIPRDDTVYKFFVPYDGGEMVPVYLCKGDNNGDTYLFSNYDWLSYLTKNAEAV